ncbi:MAG TPA: M23 family metallopeptidase, partial [Kiritimatiellia bacterium]|nr:M23 family metallopeptidase [Kiritimatiellia bacterium]
MNAAAFAELPDDPGLRLVWPTPNHRLFDQPERYFARTRANPDYGRPGWTRECGRRFHRGCDIAPVAPIPTGQRTWVMFTDCASGREYSSEEPTWLADDDIFAVAGGMVTEALTQPDVSTYGCHVVVQHAWPASGAIFFSLYAHLASVWVNQGDHVKPGALLGRMGQTSSSADARNWMAIAPHVHVEFHDADGRPFNPEAFL